jgi:hypothetical protein
MTTVDYTCFECGRDHGPRKSLYDRCPFEGRRPRPRPVPLKPTEAQLCHDAQLELRLKHAIAARERRQANEKQEREWAKTKALLQELRQEDRAAKREAGDATMAEAKDVLEPMRFVEALENNRLAKRLIERWG